MKSKVLIAAIAVAAGLSASAGRAADPDSVEELMLLLKLDQQMAQMQAIVQESADTGFQQAVKQQGLSQEQIERLQPVLEAYKRNLTEVLSWENLKGSESLWNGVSVRGVKSSVWVGMQMATPARRIWVG